jgi:hypothetical protein
MDRECFHGLGAAFAALTLCVTGVLPTLAEVPSLDTVLKACEKKMSVMGRDENGGLVKVGEAIDSYCEGFLEGTLSALAHSQKICIENQITSPDFLLSTVLTYRNATKSQDNDAAEVIEAAFRRAFSCKK